MTAALKILAFLAIVIAGVILSAMAFAVVLVVLNVVTEFVNKLVHYVLDWQARKTENNRARVQASIHRLLPDSNGYNGIVYDGQTYLNLDTGEMIAQQVQKAIQPFYDEWRIQNYEQRKLLTAMGQIHIGKDQMLALIEQQETNVNTWPMRVPLESSLVQFGIRPNINNVFLGVTMENGQQVPITTSIEGMVHCILGGNSGFGKSTMMAALMKQLIMGQDCDLCAVDLGINTFSEFAPYLKYDIAEDEKEAVCLFDELIQEGERRRALMRDVPQAKTVYQYNEITGASERAMVCFIDEGLALFKQNKTKDTITTLASLARKYAIWLILGSTSTKATILPSSCSSNFSGRLAFHLMPGLSKSLINCVDAFEIKNVGRALAMLPGRQMTEIQCPIIDDFERGLPKAIGVQIPLNGSDPTADFDKMVLNAYQEGNENISSICRALDLHTGGDDFYKVRQSMKNQGLT